ncbi:hypothetical protein BDQ12DRAFT_658383 [Crucibulum laeve]|uniref:RBR-type E3 ubiquitin transferase n=1 Tax=Crucibulum laeve TaxID=68775 RepID=A0A5C3LK15_9AGAR|nr:hypothetical protein BDQ12DRAFT_658383 [Crucibulum laeve]
MAFSSSRRSPVPTELFGHSTEDIETFILITQLALDDLEDFKKSRKGKGRFDMALSDEEYAMECQRQQLEGTMQALQDFKVAKSVDDALRTDRAYIRAYTVLERVADEDRRAAVALSNGQPLPAPSVLQRSVENAAFRVPSDGEIISHSPVSSPFGLPRPASLKNRNSNIFGSQPGPSTNHLQRVECVSCGDSVRLTAALKSPCEHYYCRECIRNLVEAMTRDESLYPLRCCKQSISQDTVLSFLPEDLRVLFMTKNREFGTLSLTRLYCPNPRCSLFLGSSEGKGGTILCPTCKTAACASCKQLAHPGDSCTASTGTVLLKELAQKKNWQTCPGCKAIVELDHGCYHMTCRCRSEFCYLCAVPWKNCRCAQWDEGRLVAAAERRVQNELGGAAQRTPANAIAFRQRVQEMTRTLRNNHDCVGHAWRRRSGGGRCEECRFHLPDYLMICRNCSVLVCLRCARNRL